MLSLIRCFHKFFICVVMLCCFDSAFAQTPQPQNPQSTIQGAIPKFSAIGSSLQTGVTYTIAISQSPRGGSNSQYLNFWTKTGVTVSDLTETNPSRVSWSTNWEQKSRNGNYDGAAVTVSTTSPSALNLGQTYYWHIVSSTGLKSAQASFTTSTANPYINSATIRVSAPLENGAKVSYGGSDVWVDATVEAAGNEATFFQYQLWEQYNNGPWVAVGKFDLKHQMELWFSNRPKPIKVGTYRYRLQVSKQWSNVWSTPFDTDLVTIRAPRAAPSATFSYFQIFDVWGYIFYGDLEEKSDKYIFHKAGNGLVFRWPHITNDIASRTDFYYEFLSKQIGQVNWTVDKVSDDSFVWNPVRLIPNSAQEPRGLHDRETYEFAIRGCNPYGCTPIKNFVKPVYLDYPEIFQSTQPAKLSFTQITLATNSIEYSKNYCFADSITKKCKVDLVRVETSAVGLPSVGKVYVYKDAFLLNSAVSVSGSVSIDSDLKDLPVGTYTFLFVGAGGADQVLLRKRFYVFVPNEGKITPPSSICTIDSNDTACNGQVAWEFTGDFPACLYKIDGTTETELACAPVGPHQGNVSVPLTASPSTFEIRAKEPSGIRTIATSNLNAGFKDVTFSATPERCDIIRPATSCLTRVSWKASAEYTPCLYKSGVLVTCSNESQLEIPVNNLNGTQFKLINGQINTDKLLAVANVKAIKVPSGTLTIANGSQNPCIPNNTNTCTVQMTFSHYGGETGVSLYKDDVEWANLGTSGETIANSFTKSVPVNVGGTRYSMKSTVEGQSYEIASLTLYTTTFTSQGYSLTATPNECTFNPVTQLGCKPAITWSLPAADACIFVDGRVILCPDSTFLNGTSAKTVDLAGSRIYQLRKGDTPTGALVAQVGVLAKEQTVADIKAELQGCTSAGCKLSLKMFNNHPGNVCLYDNGIKANGYCNLNRHNYVSDYLAAPGLHTLELKLVDAAGQTSVVAETSIELKYAPFAPSSISTVVSGNAIGINWPVSSGATSYVLERNGQVVSPSPLFLNAYSDSTVVSGTSYVYRVKACILTTLCSGWVTAAPIVFAPSDKLSINLVSPSQSQTSIQLGETITLAANLIGSASNVVWVKFYANGELINANQFKTAPYILPWAPSEGGDYVITAVVMNTSSIKTSSIPVNVTVLGSVRLNVEEIENLPAGIDADGQFTLRWSSASPADYFVLMEGDKEVYRGAETTKAFSVKAGTYNFRIKACQTQPAMCSSETVKTIKVNLGATDNVVELTIPSPDRQQTGTLGQQFALYADVKTPAGDIWRAASGSSATVDFYANGNLLTSLTTDSSGTLKFWRPSQTGSYQITAVAVVEGGKKITSRVATIKVNTNTAPVVSMTAPASHERIAEGKSIKLAAQITDSEQNVAYVVFLANGVPVSQPMTEPPYEAQWTPSKTGLYNLSIRAIDYGGLEKFSPSQPLVIEPLVNTRAPTEFLSPDYSPLTNATKVLRAEGEIGDVLALAPPNTAGISYNAFTKFVLGQPLKILNVDNSAAGSPAAKLIVIDAQQLLLNNTFEIVGAAADVLLINRVSNAQIQCSYCSFTNVGRVTIAAAQPSNALSASSTQIGELLASGTVSITKLNAPAAQVEVLGKTITTVKNDAVVAINTQQKARLSSNEYVLDEAGDKNVGTGSVNLVAGEAKVDYRDFKVLSFNANPNALMATLDGNIRSGAIKVVAASSLTINSQLSTQSDVQASFIDKGEFKLANERIELATLDNTNGHLINNGSVISDDKIKLVATGNIQNNATGTVIANNIEAIAAKNITNMGAFYCPESACKQSLTTPLVTNLYLMAEGVIDNQNTIQGFTNITLTASGDLNNRFGGSIAAANVYLNSKNGSIRNGWATPYENLPEDHWILKPSAYTQQLSTFDQFILPKINGSQTPAKKARTKEAYIFGEKIIVNAKRHVENINPSLDVYRAGTLTPKEDGASAGTVSIAALNRLEIRAEGYILNSSASISVDNNAPGSVMVLIAPQVHNERYFMYALGDVVGEGGVVIDTTYGGSITTNSYGKSLDARLYVYSPAGIIFSNAPTLFKFNAANSLTSIFGGASDAVLNKGFENNTSYFIVENDVKFDGENSIVRSKGMVLERENYFLQQTVVVRNVRCPRQPGDYSVIPICSTVNTINHTPSGETVAETIERTIFAVSGQLDGAPANFIAINQNPLDQAKERFIDEYKKEVATRLANDLSKGAINEQKFLGLKTEMLNDANGAYVFTTAHYEYLNPGHIPVANAPKETQTSETKSVWDIVIEGFAALKLNFFALLAEFEKGN